MDTFPPHDGPSPADPEAWGDVGFTGFVLQDHVVAGQRLRVRTGGRPDGPPLLLLHGFPQTHVLWRRVAQQLAPHFALVLPDLRGYGDSAAPPGEPGHANYSKRAMAGDLHALMQALGHPRYAVAGHDRGGRVAHRLALDQPEAVTRLAVLDIAPTLDMYEATDMRLASAYYHWFFLIQPAPHPETLIGGSPLHYLHWKLAGWGSGPRGFMEPAALAEYERCFVRPQTIHAMCEDYRAAATIDLEHDRASREQGRRIACPLQVLWGERGVIHALFDPMRLWRAAADGPVSGRHLPCGHFMPEERPQEVADELLRFFGA